MNLVQVQSGISLDQPAATAWLGIERTARDLYGVDLNITAPYGGYRSPAMERAMWAERFNKVKYPNGVAAPGSSVHRFGRSFDISNWGLLGSAILDSIARQFGAVRTIPGERWHYEFRGGGSGGVLPPGTTNLADPYREIISSITKAGPDMKCKILGNLDTGQVVYIIKGGEGHIFNTAAEYEDYRTVVQAYNAMSTTPDEWKDQVPPPLDQQNVLFVSNARWVTTIRVECI